MEGARLVDGMTPEEFAEVQRVHQVMLKAMDKELWQLAQFMVTRRDDQLLGETEFAVRDNVLRMGAQALGATIDDRKKRATKAAAWSAPIAVRTPVSLGGGRGPSSV
jgi:hypothetical protein